MLSEKPFSCCIIFSVSGVCVCVCACMRANVQDAQEFSKLFLSVLESALVQGPLGQPSNVVQEQFAGTYCYITRSVY